MKSLLRRILGPLVVVATMIWMGIILCSERAALQAIRWSEGVGELVLHILLMLIFTSLLLIGWRSVLACSGLIVNRRTVLGAWLAPNIGKYVPAKVGMLIGRIEVCKANGISRGDSLAAFVAEHVLSIGSAFLYIALITAGGLLHLERQQAVLLMLVVVGILLVLLRPQLITEVLNRTLRLLGREPVGFRLKKRALLGLFPFYVLVWAIYGVAGFMICEIVAPDQVEPLFAMGAFVVSWLIGFLSFLPGGFGARELVLTGLLSPCTGSAPAVAIAMISRLSWTLLDLGGVALGVAVLSRGATPEKPVAGEGSGNV